MTSRSSTRGRDLSSTSRLSKSRSAKNSWKLRCNTMVAWTWRTTRFRTSWWKTNTKSLTSVTFTVLERFSTGASWAKHRLLRSRNRSQLRECTSNHRRQTSTKSPSSSKEESYQTKCARFSSTCSIRMPRRDLTTWTVSSRHCLGFARTFSQHQRSFASCSDIQSCPAKSLTHPTRTGRSTSETRT